jgi:hypothetical protein
MIGNESISMLGMVTSAFCTSVTMAVNIALLIVALTVVAKHRKDAAFVLASAAGLFSCGTLFSAFGYSLGSFAIARASSPPDFRMFTMFSSAMRLGTTLFYVAGSVCLIVAMIRLARFPREREGGA